MSKEQFDSQFEKFSYSLGLGIASNLLGSGIKNVDFDTFVMAIKDAFEGNLPKIDAEEANKILQEHLESLKANELQKNLEVGRKFLSENKENEGVVELESGLQYSVITAGSGEKPKATDQVKCHYHGTLIDGTIFDSSVQRGEPAVFPVNGVIQGWVEALQLMEVGSKWRLFIPPNLAYGENGAGGSIGPNSTLIFDVELLGIE